MKAMAVYPGLKQVRLVSDHPEPQLINPTDVKLRMLDIGVCGTDKEICAFDYGTPPKGSDRLVIGHESLGEVVATGPGVSGLKPGDLVVTMVRRPCSHADCPACRAGRQDFCYTGEFTERGINGQHGYMTEFVVDDERYMNLVPPALRDVAVLVEPLTIAEKALIEVGRVQQRLPWARACEPDKGKGYCHRALVLGAGPVGLLGAMALVASNFETYVYSRETKPNLRSNLVESFGAHYISSVETPVEALPGVIGNIDVVYEAVGASGLAFDVMKVFGTNGIFVFTGVPGRKAPIELDTDLIMRNLVLKNQIVLGSVNSGKNGFEAAIRDLGRFMEMFPDAVRALITGRYPIEMAADVLQGKVGGIKNVITLAPPRSAP